jgi:hypothetical protein
LHHVDLLRQAERLARLDPKRPRQANLRRDTDDISAQMTSAGLPHFSLALPQDRQWTAEDLGEYLQKFGPIICAGTMHTVLLVDIHENHQIVHKKS